jgi:CheY-like chemotaxis protein
MYDPITDYISLHDKTILVADDNPANLQLMESMLSKFDCQVRVAMDGLAALKIATSQPIDLILLDIHMPNLDGYQTCEKIKQDPDTKEIPIIFVSAINEEFNKVKGFASGATDYITKPVQFEELQARMETHLRLATQRRQLLQQTEDLQSMNENMMGREHRIIELKKEVNDLCEQLGKEALYPEVF